MKPAFIRRSFFVVCGGATTSVRPGTSFPPRQSTSRIELSAAPEEKSRFPSGCHASPSQAWSSASFWITWRRSMSTTRRLGFDQPLFVITRWRPSG